MNFLRLLSSRAYQNITFTCVNSVIWLDARTQNYRYGVRLMGDSGQEWSANRKHIKPTVLVDDCTVHEKLFFLNSLLYLCFYLKMSEPRGKTVLEVRTNKLNTLPLVDFLPLDYGAPHQAFGFNLGPVCFS